MKLEVLPYVTVEIDDRLRRRLRRAGEQLRVNVRAYLLSAADDVDAAGERVRDLCGKAVNRVDSVVATVNDRLDLLLDAGLIAPNGAAASTGGRRAASYAFNRDSGVVYVADLGASAAGLAPAGAWSRARRSPCRSPGGGGAGGPAGRRCG